MTEVYVNTRTATFPGGTGIPSVVVRLYDSLGVFITTATTDGTGSAYLGDRAAAAYEIRISAPAPGKVQNNTIQSITVPASASDYVFDVIVDDSTLPPATDTLMCRCSGYFKDSNGRPAPRVSIRFSESASTPALLLYAAADTTHAVIPSNTLVTTNGNGYAQVDLIRGKDYQLFMEGYENISRIIRVPDLSAAPLPDVLFPFVDRIEWLDALAVIMPTSAPTLTINVGDLKALTVQTAFRSGLIEAGLKDANVVSDDAAVASVTISDGDVVVTGVSAGTATLEVTRVEVEEGCGITICPEPAIIGSLVVTVNP
jgi:hypothetical protein